MISTGIQLPDELADELDDEVNARNLAKPRPRASRASVIREAITEFLRRPRPDGETSFNSAEAR